MDIIEYLKEKIEEEGEILQELIRIDNNISKSNITYNDLLSLNSKIINIPKFNNSFNVLTDGDIFIIYNLLISNSENINAIHILRTNVGINTYLVTRVNEYYQNKGISKNIILDIKKDYSDYLNNSYPLAIVGESSFVKGTKNLFLNYNPLEIII